jgi:putative flippase GtrA
MPATPTAAGIPIIGKWLPPGLRQVFWFGVVGGSGAIAFIVLSTLMLSLRTGLADWVVSTLCYAALILPVYLAHRALSFRSDAPHTQALPRYVATQACALVLAAIISYGVYALPGLPNVVAAALVSALTSIFTFIVLRLWAFTAPR